MCTAYKIYAEILRKKVEKEVTEIKLLLESQGGFRRETETIDNIFVLIHLVQQKKGEERKNIRLFVDLKAAFDNIDEDKLGEVLEEKKIKPKLIRKLKRIYKDTKVAFRTEN